MNKRSEFYGIPGELVDLKREINKYQWLYEEPFRSCKATVGKVGRFIYLRSYQTIVSFIDTGTDTLFDVLRTEYGYTATSSQHIAKFRQDYRHYFKGVIITKRDGGRVISEIYY